MEEEAGTLIDVGGGFSVAALTGLVFALVEMLKPLAIKVFGNHSVPLLSLVIGVGLTLLAWEGGLVVAENQIAALFIGITVGLGGSGVHGVAQHYQNGRNRPQEPPGEPEAIPEGLVPPRGAS